MTRRARIRQIKRAVAAGRYKVDSRQVAEAMLERERRKNTSRSELRSHRV